MRFILSIIVALVLTGCAAPSHSRLFCTQGEARTSIGSISGIICNPIPEDIEIKIEIVPRGGSEEIPGEKL